MFLKYFLRIYYCLYFVFLLMLNILLNFKHKKRLSFESLFLHMYYFYLVSHFLAFTKASAQGETSSFLPVG